MECFNPNGNPGVALGLRVLHALTECRNPERSDEAAFKNLTGVVDRRELTKLLAK
jgi:hypothetical protein